MPRHRARIDSNQPLIVEALRAIGASVETLAAVGKGVPDLLVGYQGKNYLMEIKDPAKPPSGRKLTKDQVRWHGKWGGQKAVVHTPTEALISIGIEAPPIGRPRRQTAPSRQRQRN